MELRQTGHAIRHVEGTNPGTEGWEAILQPLAGTRVMAGDRLLFAGILHAREGRARIYPYKRRGRRRGPCSVRLYYSKVRENRVQVSITGERNR